MVAAQDVLNSSKFDLGTRKCKRRPLLLFRGLQCFLLMRESVWSDYTLHVWWIQASPLCYSDSCIVLVLKVVRGRVAVSRIKEQSAYHGVGDITHH